MDKGDKKSFRGKIFMHSYGNKRRKKVNGIIISKEPLLINHGKQLHDKGLIAENFVNNLSFNTYLKYWCFPNPKDEDGDKKEICDLLISFFDTLIIISVKNYDVKGNYDRYNKKVINKSSNQIFGAEKKIFNLARIIRIKHPERGLIELNPLDYKNIFRITINLGEQFEYYELVDNDIKKGCVAILNISTFKAIIDELDTIKDLIEYLKSRETLILATENKPLKCAENDILAYYLMNNKIFPPEFYSQNFENASLELHGKWHNYLDNKSVILKKLYNSSSYFIDELIKNDVLKITNGELIAKELMTLNRFERRNIADSLFEIVKKYDGQSNILARKRFLHNGIMFLFIYYPKNQSESNVDEILQLALEIYAYKFRTNKILLLAATDKLIQWKFGLHECYDFSEITEETKKRLDNYIEHFGWFKKELGTEKEVKEYPDEE